MRHKMRHSKGIMLAVITVLVSLVFAITACASTWRRGEEPDQSEWWYDNEDGTYAQNGWQWIDGDGDGIAECYYFDSDGWMAADEITPDGYEVNADGAWIVDGVVMTQAALNENEDTQENIQGEENIMKIQVMANGNSIIFELNDSEAAKSLYAQLPLTVENEDFSNNEKTFYPPQRLNVSGAPHTDGSVGTLAYYEPWGDVVLFYGSYNPNNALYALGKVIEGSEFISSISGEMTITAAE